MMNRRGGWTSSASSKASPSTTCQKCLKKGHYSYECKVSQAERPYISRPSRTQQLFDPNVRQKLTMAVPPEELEKKNDLTRKQGVADEILAKKEKERSSTHKRRRDSPSVSPVRRRRRSPSISSVSSYSSASSRSPSPPPRRGARKSRSLSPDRRASRKSRSPSPDRRVRRRYRDSPSPVGGRGRKLEDSTDKRRDRSRSSAHSRRTPLPETHKQPPPPPPPQPPQQPRERSLSPFSRRLALTKAIGGGGRP